MKKSVILLIAGIFATTLMYSQAPGFFKYQAVVRNNNGQAITNQAVSVMVKILQGSSSGQLVYSESQSVNTNEFGIMNLEIGNGTVQSGSFSSIDWSKGPYFFETDVDPAGGSTYQNMGTVQLLSVPYALYSNKTKSADRFEVLGNVTSSDSALFIVKDRNGNPVFAVYETGVEVTYNVNPLSKGGKGGFAVGGRTTGKGAIEKIVKITTDSVRIYIDTTQAKGGKGGFAVGGRTTDKGSNMDYFSISNSKIPEIINPSKPRILWYPSKSSFLAGQVLIENPDSIGMYSIAVGDSAKAIGSNSQAFGYRPIARSNYSTAIGNNALAAGNVSFALGSGAQATGDYSFAFGSTGLNEDGTVSGAMTTASGKFSFAFGQGSTSTGYGSFSYGMNCDATGDFSTAIGLGSHASGRSSMSLGYYNTSQAYKSIVLGTYNVISGTSDSWVDTEPLFVLGNGTGGYFFIRPTKGSKGHIIIPPIFKPGIIRPPIFTIIRSNAFMVFKNGNSIIGGGSTYYTDPACRLFIYKKAGNSTTSNYEKGLVIREGGAYDKGVNFHIIDDAGNSRMYVTSSNSSSSTTMYVTSANSSATYALYISGNGYMTGTWSGASDIRWKKNVKPLENVIDKIRQFDAVQFEWRTNEFPEMNFSKGSQIGVIAQEVEKVFPELVKTDDKGYKSVAYDRLAVIAISAIKLQQKEIERLKSKVESLENENARFKSLQSQIDELKTMIQKK